LQEEPSRARVCDFALTCRVEGPRDRGDTELDLVAVNEGERAIRFGSRKRSPMRPVPTPGYARGVSIEHVHQSTVAPLHEHVEIGDELQALVTDHLALVTVHIEGVTGHLEGVDDHADGDANERVAAIVAYGDAAVPVLVREIQSLDAPTGWPKWDDTARSAAFNLLLAIDTELSGGAAAAILRDEHADTWLHSYIREAAVQSGSRCFVDALCATAEAASDVRDLGTLCDVLASRPERSDRVLALLIRLLRQEPVFGAMALIHYGDESALPALYEAIEAIPDVDDEFPAFASAPAFASDWPDLVEAVHELGGGFEGPLEAKVQRLQERARRESARIRIGMRMMAAKQKQAVLTGADIPTKRAPNAPCPCGSGTKTKKCCG